MTLSDLSRIGRALKVWGALACMSSAFSTLPACSSSPDEGEPNSDATFQQAKAGRFCRR